ncbi:DNA polymerase III subunit gamma/tau [Halocella sp. SP3-1]|uniref:DNA polymerase III subunit gamma/tau n=1 Tax=Halocella sp. SP3-1 TaxID=2382161 RepID=UPI000F7650C4|nr:DNA polymerase III subunit gamma/tau [Halocella sp. SP3-1]AZO93673.1 DNA polymerase III subunit gamma/tau [Halocella sp. SP3-1]
MAFLSLYRKYRPDDFEGLIGQEHVVKTLKNTLQTGRIGHAYLFAGPRGTGKTSTAKVFAKALNCVKGPTIDPCGECPACQKINSGQSLDVIEIDAASNRGIDEIRDLREKVKFYPTEGDYKVYIIDEVHMLTKGAFNALLKTLEEPPENVVFILATTEPHRVIDTILSRCQRYDFSLITIKDIKKRLKYICQAESVTYHEGAVDLIARSSNGGMRDAISLLDQAISFTNGQLDENRLQEMLGKVDSTVLVDLFNKIVNKETAAAIELLNQIIDRGNALSVLLDDLIGYLRQLLLIKECGGKTSVLDLPEERIEELLQESNKVDISLLINFIEELTRIKKDFVFTEQPQILLEMGIIKLAALDQGDSLTALKSRIASLELALKELLEGKRKARPPVSVDKQGGQEVKTVNNTKPSVIEDKSEDKKNVVKKKERDTGPAENSNITITIEQVRELWPVILEKIKEKDISVQAYLLEGKPEAVIDNCLSIEFPEDKSFHKNAAARKLDLVKKVITTVLGTDCQLVFKLRGEELAEAKKKELTEQESNNGDREDDRDDLVARVADFFEGEVIKVNYEVLEDKGT